MGLTKVTSVAQFTDAAKSDKVTVAIFTASWAGGPSIIGKAAVEKKANATTDANIQFFEIDFDDYQTLANTYGVKSLPVTIAIRKDKVADKHQGIISAEQIDALIKKAQDA